MTLAGFTWTCRCGAWARFPFARDRDRDLIKHTRECGKCPPGSEVRDTRTGALLYRKP